MTTLEHPTNGHARFSTDLLEKTNRWELPVRDPIADDERAKPRTKKEQHLLADFDRWLKEALADEAPERQLPEFPIDALPKPLRNWAEAEARRTQTPIDVAAMLSLASSSAAIARKTFIEARPGRRAPANLFVGLMAGGGDRNAEVMNWAIRPLREIEREEIKAFPKQKVDHEELARLARAEFADQERAAKRDDAASRDETMKMVAECRAILESLRPPAPPRRILDEVNARNIARELGRQGRIACFSSNGDIFRQLMGRMSAARDRLVDLLHIGHSATTFVATMEHERLESVNIPAITVASIFDPSLAASIAGKRNFRERSLLARFLFVAPKSKIGRREIAPPPMSEEVEAAYRDGIRKLAAREMTCLTLSQDADLLFREFEAEIESQLGDGGRLASIGEWAAALPGQVLRIAAILHSSKSDETVVFRDTLAAAIAIGRYLLPHAAHVLETISAADDDCDESERPLLRYARVARSFTARDAMQHLRKTYLSPAALAGAVAGLIRRGYLRAVGQGLPCRDTCGDSDRASPDLPSGRPPSPRFELAELRVWGDVIPVAPSVSGAAPPVKVETTESTQNLAAVLPESRPLTKRERRKEARRRRNQGR